VKHSKQPLQWTTPLGLPVVQPYLKEATTVVRSVAGTDMSVDVSLDSSDGQPDTRKSATAFPPNFVHSLDSSHMMMTANACAKAGLSFAAVHDSFWTHACDVDVMNAIIREEFVKLYEAPHLENLKAQLMASHEGLDLNGQPMPTQGELDLSSVKESLYFFA